MKISIEQDDGTFRELPRPMEVSLDMSDAFGPRLLRWVSPEHPNLYGVALRAAAESDRALMRAVVVAALANAGGGRTAGGKRHERDV